MARAAAKKKTQEDFGRPPGYLPCSRTGCDGELVLTTPMTVPGSRRPHIRSEYRCNAKGCDRVFRPKAAPRPEE